MDNDKFIERKKVLNNKLIELTKQKLFTDSNLESIDRLIRILDAYTFENRLRLKGLLSHTIVDSIDLENPIADELIKFDNDII